MMVIEPISRDAVIYASPLSSPTHTPKLNYLTTKAPNFAPIGIMTTLAFSQLKPLSHGHTWGEVVR
jgi:hypothetical protein